MKNISLIGKKCGMTRIFTEEGMAIPVSVIEVLPNRIVQIKSLEKDGYTAIQVTVGQRKSSRINKPETGHFSHAGVEPGKKLCEFSLTQEEIGSLTVGSELKLDCLEIGQYVDLIGTTKGKGFAGVIKRHHFATQDASHGNSLSHRVPGSIGQRQSPGKVFKGKLMAGHLGDVKRTILSLKVERLDMERQLVFIKGAVPGAAGSYVIIRPAVKKSQKGAA